MDKSPKYYSQTVVSLGWHENSQPDKERLSLLNQFTIGKKILDVGCGYGLYTDYLCSQGYKVTGLDFVESFINYARKFKKGTFLKGKADNLPFKNEEFDTVLLFDILEHGDDIKILNEAKRVSNNLILAIVPRRVDRILEQSGVIFRHYLDKSHLREYDQDDIKKLATKTNLKLIHLQKIHPLYNETIFLNLFKGKLILRKILRKLIFLLLPQEIYPTEYFAVFKK